MFEHCGNDSSHTVPPWQLVLRANAKTLMFIPKWHRIITLLLERQLIVFEHSMLMMSVMKQSLRSQMKFATGKSILQHLCYEQRSLWSRSWKSTCWHFEQQTPSWIKLILVVKNFVFDTVYSLSSPRCKGSSEDHEVCAWTSVLGGWYTKHSVWEPRSIC